MKRFVIHISIAVLALGFVSSASATTPHSPAPAHGKPVHHRRKSAHARKRSRKPAHRTSASPVRGTATGTVTAFADSWFTIQTSGRRMGRVNAMIATASAIAQADYSYVWGGGHAEAGVPTHSGRTVGFDCSGSVAAVLAGAGLWPAGSGVPNDAGVIAQLRQEGLIAPGAGKGPNEVTLYDHPGIHIFMNIDGRFFGTSDGAGGGSAKGGPGWLYDGAPDAAHAAFKQYHLLPSVLRDSATYGHTITFERGAGPDVLAGVQMGDQVRVTYRQRANAEIVATALSWVGAVSTSGTVLSLASDGSSLTLVGTGGAQLTLPLSGNVDTGVLGVGDQVEVTYTQQHGTVVVRSLAVTAAASTQVVDGTVGSVAGDETTFTLQTAGGETMTFSASDPSLIDGVQAGDGVEVTYVAVGTTLIAQDVSVTDTLPDPTS